MSTSVRPAELWWNPHPMGTSGLVIQCPTCRCPLTSLCDAQRAEIVCPGCFGRLRKVDGIWRALAYGRDAHFQQFTADYETVRAAEGRGSADPAYYLALPFADLTGHNADQWQIRGRTFTYLQSHVLPALEAARRSGLDVLDLGAGNGWLSYRLASRGHRPVAVDLLTNSFDGLGAAMHYAHSLPELFPRFQAEFDRLPFGDAQFDLAIFNASFHYSEDYERTLAECLRCLRPGGTVVLADSPWYRHESSGREMLDERRQIFLRRFGFASDSIASLEFLTEERLQALEKRFGIRWQTHQPEYGWRWRLRPWIARLKRRREPSQFRLYLAEVKRP